MPVEVNYADDALSLETEVNIIDPSSGASKGFTCDNLTSVMWFLVEHDLKPLREGLKDKAGNLEFSGEMNKPLGGDGPLKGATAGDVLNGWRNANTLPITLYIEVEGDPELVDRFDE